MSEWGRPYRTTEELLETELDTMGEIFTVIVDLSNMVESFFNKSTGSKYNPENNEFKDKKTQKGFKEANKMAKSFKKVGGVWGMALSFIESLGVFEPLLDLVEGVISVIGGFALESIADDIKRIADILFSDEMMDFWELVGTTLGGLIAAGLEPVVQLLQLFSDILGDLGISTEDITKLFKILGHALAFVTIVGLLPIIGAIYGVGLVIAGIVDFISWLIDVIDFLNITPIRATNAVGAWNDLLLPIMGSIAGTAFGNLADIADIVTGGMAEGGIAMKPILTNIAEKEPEVVAPLSKLRLDSNEEILLEIRDNIESQTQVIRRNERNQRRRFG